MLHIDIRTYGILGGPTQTVKLWESALCPIPRVEYQTSTSNYVHKHTGLPQSRGDDGFSCLIGELSSARVEFVLGGVITHAKFQVLKDHNQRAETSLGC